MGKPDDVVCVSGALYRANLRAGLPDTGLLQILLESIHSILPSWDQEGQAVALVTIVGGFIGAFNGFATYPVTIPGLIDLDSRASAR